MTPTNAESDRRGIADYLREADHSTGNVAADDRLWGVQDVAAYLMVSTGWVYDQARRDVLPSAMIGKHLRFRRQDIEAYVDRAFG
jgi:excisionase family DNA binding protein